VRFLIGAVLVIVAIEAFCQSPINNSVGSASSIGMGGAGGTASSIGNGYGGMGGAGGLGGIGHGGEGGNGFGGTGGIGQGGAANNAGNSLSTSIQYDQVRQSPAVFMSAPMPTAVCQATAGGFLSFVAGAGFAASFTLDQCEIREEARSLVGMGRPDLALRVMCGNAKFTSKLSECKGM
jgi:hypothetical protein